MRLGFWNLLLVFTLLLAGCGGKDRPVAVQGKVTLDGKPLEKGKISFITPGQVPEQLEIAQGTFQGKVKAGKRRVEIGAYRPYQIPPEVPESMRPLMQGGEENYLPDAYHTNSTLEANVTPGGDNQFTFPLISSPSTSESASTNP